MLAVFQPTRNEAASILFSSSSVNNWETLDIALDHVMEVLGDRDAEGSVVVADVFGSEALAHESGS
jgi:hypothetical protein